MRRIHYNPTIGQWFQQNFGEPFKWGGEVLEPTALKQEYQWATGRHSKNGNTEAAPVIWCDEQVYMLYKLRWSQ